MVKPFETKEVVARINAVLRRAGKQSGGKDEVKEVHYENLSINLTNYELKVKGVQVDTPPQGDGNSSTIWLLTPTGCSPGISF